MPTSETIFTVLGLRQHSMTAEGIKKSLSPSKALQAALTHRHIDSSVQGQYGAAHSKTAPLQMDKKVHDA